MSDITMTCEAFDALLEGYLEGALDHTTQSRADQHRGECAACAAIVADLEGLVRSAQALPLPTPSRDLWPDIEARLVTPVRVLPVATPHTMARSVLPWRQLAAAAAVLVTVSAGVTWNVARRAPAASSTTLASTDTAVVVPSVAPDANVSAPRVIDVDAANATAMPPSTLGGSVSRDARTSGYVASAPNAPMATPTRVVAASNGNTGAVALDTLYGREIAMLRTVAETQLGLLDSTTVSVVRKNLDIIDNAIRESRTALAADPNSGFLLEQLDRAYERKVDLLRRLALL
jgi:hypothetical protein